MSNREQYLDIDGLREVMQSIKELYASKSHTHDTDNINGLSAVAKSGKYIDLIGAPQSISVNPATQTTLGTVKPGTAMGVNNGVMSLKIAENGGGIVYDPSKNGISLKIDLTSCLKINTNNELTLNVGEGLYIDDYKKICVDSNNIVIEKDSWGDLYATFCGEVSSYKNSGKKDGVTYICINSLATVNNTIIIHIDNINLGYIDTFISNNESVLDNMFGNLEVNDWKIIGCCETQDELRFYEKMKMIASDNVVDTCVFHIYSKIIGNETNFKNIIESNLGKKVYDLLRVEDTENRIQNLITEQNGGNTPSVILSSYTYKLDTTMTYPEYKQI